MFTSTLTLSVTKPSQPFALRYFPSQAPFELPSVSMPCAYQAHISAISSSTPASTSCPQSGLLPPRLESGPTYTESANPTVSADWSSKRNRPVLRLGTSPSSETKSS